ncbi:putative DNA-binding protein (MmcQ/YjbR family) [Breznakia sp. PF5-3]|uniref:MmcQ/YjbR family DNA-binding protein n=1 Tax=unclassified Breznakia TaxID=2623764 RepID=UPI002406A74E|nr:MULTISPECIES: MmcQ/YjbR family DNA-binding protein [unclassified Breznakia]MDF9824866.1 putative DNA-binding protein (MmcQ/YjbR family) [Breznakia sp. PM6-1]MDF9835723.1 putative DNA-binding protein (MmcQ/YjbR family) [Breznakia sp. PF5-3]MDF9838899.1 putative DNA-binding protein (MmcQ/YjbR family) [Breznakia sp. PFB2-8]MDF9860925.1 putative DNA-binding protein (MmcQ/YjbR family) [Breznakia sp. PH5-24]
MLDTESLFKNKKMNIEALLTYGFKKHNEAYVYKSSLGEEQFDMIVTITKTGEVLSEVIDVATDETYILHLLKSAQGSFVSAIREEYVAKLSEVAECCFDMDVFKSEYAKQVIQYAKETYQDELEFLWKKTPNNAILRRKETNQWYAALLTIKKSKLGIMEDGLIEVIDLRYNPEELVTLIDNKRYFPGYHMNKKHWYTICLDGSVPIEEIYQRIDKSYVLANK